MSLTDNGFVYTGRLRGYESAFEANLRALGTAHHQLHPAPPANVRQDRTVLADPEEVAPRPPGPQPPSPSSTTHWNSSATSTTTTARTERCAGPPRPRHSPRPPRPAPPTGRCPHRYSSPATPSANNSGNLFVPPYRVNVGLRWAGHQCDGIRHGDQIAIFSGTNLIREFTADPTRNYQPSDKTTRTYRTPRTQTGIMSVSDVPRHKCQRCPETPHCAQRGNHAEIATRRRRRRVRA